RERKGIEDGSAGVEPVPRTGPDRAHRDQSVGSRRGALCEQGRLGWWLSEDLERRWWAREVVCVDLVVGAAAGRQRQVMGVGDQSEWSLALVIHGRRERLDRPRERIGAEQPVVRHHAVARPSFGGPVVVDREEKNRVRQ